MFSCRQIVAILFVTFVVPAWGPHKEEPVLALKVSADVFVALAMALTLAGCFETFERPAFVGGQPVYYPVLQIMGGIGETLGTVLTFVLLLVTPAGTEKFNWLAAAFSSLMVMHLVYWMVAYPVRNSWRDGGLVAVGRRFFGLSAAAQWAQRKKRENLWPELKPWWELSNIVRAFFAFVGVVTLGVAVAM